MRELFAGLARRRGIRAKPLSDHYPRNGWDLMGKEGCCFWLANSTWTLPPIRHIYFAMINATPQQLRHAADLQEKIQELQSEIDEILCPGEVPTPFFKSTNGKGKRNMSAAGRAAIAAAARARWAKYRSAKGIAKPGKPARKNKMSAAGRAAIAASMKARWAKAKKAGKTPL